jgi:hypothetical protein
MSTKNKTIAKSLHTITVFINVAKLIQGQKEGIDDETAVHMAADVLGYGDAADPYDLKGRALAYMNRES